MKKFDEKFWKVLEAVSDMRYMHKCRREDIRRELMLMPRGEKVKNKYREEMRAHRAAERRYRNMEDYMESTGEYKGLLNLNY